MSSRAQSEKSGLGHPYFKYQLQNVLFLQFGLLLPLNQGDLDFKYVRSTNTIVAYLHYISMIQRFRMLSNEVLTLNDHFIVIKFP